MSAGASGGMGPLEAFQARSRFAARRGDAAWRLAMHAAVPQSFRPELLHLLKLNFVPQAADDPAVEADVLLAPFSDDLGGGYFQFDPEVRRLLLDDLGQAYADEPVLRVHRVAGFLLAYVDRAERRAPTAHDRLGREFLETQRWVALAFARPEAAAEQLAAALQQAEAEPALGARLHLGGLAHAVAIPLAHHRELLDYALGLHALESGDAETATGLLEPLSRGFTVGGVTLSPARVLPTRTIPAQTDEPSSSPATETVAEPSAAPEPAESAAADETAGETTDASAVGETAEAARRERVFISGTYVGLREYREAAANVCRRLGLNPLMMEDWVSTADGTPLERTLQEIGQADLFLCIVGGRYGFIPEGEERSLTEIEYDAALAAGIPIFCFLAPLTPHETDVARLMAFREKILRSSIVYSIGDVESFSTLLSSVLSDWPDARTAAARLAQPPAPARALPRLFLAHGENERSFAEQLYAELGSTGYQVWMAQMELDTFRTDARYDATQAALASVEAMVLVLDGPIDPRSFMAVEVRLAVDAGIPVVCVLRGAAGPEDVPWEISPEWTLDFRDQATFPAAFQQLRRLLEPPAAAQTDEVATEEGDVAAGLGPLINVPPLPDDYVAREDDLSLLRSLLLTQPVSTVLTGRSGIGKSVLAAALARDETVQRQFPDGVVWVPVGVHETEAEVDMDLTHALGADPVEALASRKMLLVLDNVDDIQLVRPFLSAAKRSQVVLTSRRDDLERETQARFKVSSLEPWQALELLAKTAGVSREQMPSEAGEAAWYAGYIPQALIRLGYEVRAGASWRKLLSRMREEADSQSGKGSGAQREDQRPDRQSEFEAAIPDLAQSSGLSRFIGEQIVRAQGAHDLSRNPEFASFQFIGYRTTDVAVDLVALCDADGITENEVVRLRDEFFDIVRKLPHEYGLEPRGNPNGLLGFVFASGCPEPMARFIARQTRLSHADGTGGLVVAWAIDADNRRIHTHDNPVSIFPPVVVSAQSVYPGLEFLQAALEPAQALAASTAQEPAAESTAGDERIRILYLVAGREDRPLQPQADYWRIGEDLLRSKDRRRLEFIPAFAATIDDVIRVMLEHRPNIVHFSGYGGAEGIVLRNQKDEPSLASDEGIGKLFDAVRNSISCVVLHSCWKESLARAIRNSVPYVVGTRAEMSEQGGFAFLEGFYSAIAAGRDVPFAFEMGRARVQIDGRGDERFLALLGDGERPAS